LFVIFYLSYGAIQISGMLNLTTASCLNKQASVLLLHQQPASQHQLTFFCEFSLVY